jgi:hypothetical protein
MFDVIDTLPAARALAEQLGATVPPFPVVTSHPTATGWIPEADAGAIAENMAGIKAAARFLLEAVDWNVVLLDGLAEQDDLSADASDVISWAWVWASSAVGDPRVPIADGSRSPAECLAYFALVRGPMEPENWRECDRAAALEVLPFVEARVRANPDEYLSRAGDIEAARVSLIMFEPTMPDRRPITA